MMTFPIYRKIKFHGSKAPTSCCFLSALGNAIGIRLWFPLDTGFANAGIPLDGVCAVNPEVETKFGWYKPPNIGTL